MFKLNRLERTDLEEIFKERNNPDTMIYTRQFLPLHWEDHLEWFQKQRIDPKIEMFAIRDAINELIGVCGLTSIDYINSKAEFSLYIFSGYRRLGYGTNCLEELMKIGFDKMNINMIWGETFEGNPAEMIFKKCHFKYTGMLPQSYYRDGEYINSHFYAITKQTYNSKVK